MSKFIGSSYFLEILGYSELTTSFCPRAPYKYSLFSVCHGVEKGGKRWHRMNQEPGMAARRSPNRMLYQPRQKVTGSWTQTGVVWLREELHLRHCAGKTGRTLWSNGQGRWGMRSGRMSTELLGIRGVGKNTWFGAGMALFWKGPESTHEGFVDPTISVVTTQLCHCSTKAALDNTHKGHGSDPINFYKNGWGANLPTPGLIRPPVSTLQFSTSATPGGQHGGKARRIQWAIVQSTKNSVSHIKAFVRC